MLNRYSLCFILVSMMAMFSMGCKKNTNGFYGNLFGAHSYLHQTYTTRTVYDSIDHTFPISIVTDTNAQNVFFTLPPSKDVNGGILFDEKILSPYSYSDTLIEYRYHDLSIIHLYYFPKKDSVSIIRTRDDYYMSPATTLRRDYKEEIWNSYK